MLLRRNNLPVVCGWQMGPFACWTSNTKNAHFHQRRCLYLYDRASASIWNSSELDKLTVFAYTEKTDSRNGERLLEKQGIREKITVFWPAPDDVSTTSLDL